MAEISIRESVRSFVKWKAEVLSDDSPYSKAMMAKLRQGVGKQMESRPDVWDIVLDGLDERLLSLDGRISAPEKAIYTALTLYAVHQQGKSESMNRGNDSFGAAIKKLRDPDGGNAQSIKRRFDAIVTANGYTELSFYARGMVQLLKSKDIPLDYGLFAADLYGLGFPDTKSRVLLRWGEDYYRKGTVEKSKKEESANEQ
ncbi:MAG: type I-E CRISPR-associated protein Cse2/CasB [Clostridiales bacterium]|nr:type I-E CRISPR-associated protein Cse2/CasB [Clostridiales bacterium]